MPMLKCRECGKEISSEAQFCPYCGCPSKKQQKINRIQEKNTQSTRILQIMIGIFFFVIGVVLFFTSLSSMF